MTTQTPVSDLKINKLTSAQYATITPSATELYFLTDDSGITSSDVTGALGYTPVKKVSVNNTALTQSGGICTWTITNSIGGDVHVKVYKISSNEQIIPDSITVTDSTVTIKLLSTSNIAANTYKAVIEG